VYEEVNHLGNVLVTVSDKKIPVLTAAGSSSISFYNADIITATDFYPFGMAQPNRKFAQGTSKYKYGGIDGQEKETDLNDNITTAMYWEYDSRIGRRWNVDVVRKNSESPYACLGSNPIWITDRNGSDTVLYTRNGGDKLAAFTKKGGDARNLIYTVDELTKGYDAKNPWASAVLLKYDVGSKVTDPKKKKGITGESLPKDHPLRYDSKTGKGGTLAGQPVYETDLYDVTKMFFKVMQDGKSNFTPTLTGPWQYWFSNQVTDDGPYDLKSTKRTNTEIPCFAAIKIGEWTVCGGQLRRYDDYGNISYGYWGRLYGFSENFLLKKASDNQDTKNGKTTTGIGDEPRDKYAIMMGFGFYKILK
jgi:hypothetical protein